MSYYRNVTLNDDIIGVIESYCELLETTEELQCFNAEMTVLDIDKPSYEGCRFCAYALQCQYVIDMLGGDDDPTASGWNTDYGSHNGMDPGGNLSITEWIANEWEVRVIAAIEIPFQIGNRTHYNSVIGLNDTYKYDFKTIASLIRGALEDGNVIPGYRFAAYHLDNHNNLLGNHEGEYA